MSHRLRPLAMFTSALLASVATAQPRPVTCEVGDNIAIELCGQDLEGSCGDPDQFSDILCDQTWCATAFADGGTRDTDWYGLDHPGGVLRATLESEFPGVVFLVENAELCAPSVVAEGYATAGTPGVAQAVLPAGFYVVFVSLGDENGGIFDGYPCDEGLTQYRVHVECNAGCECLWDLDGDCDVTASDLAILLAAWGTYGPEDLAALLANWGCAPPAAVACQPGDIIEAEECGSDTNGGCSSTPNPFTDVIFCGDTRCGTAWADGGTRDVDWYIVEWTGGGLTATLESDFTGVVFLVDGIKACAPVVVGTPGASAPGVPGVAEAELPAGTYAVFVATDVFEGFPCDSEQNQYRVTLACRPDG